MLPCSYSSCDRQVELLLERECSAKAWEASLLKASRNHHPGVVSALLRKRAFIGDYAFQTALQAAVGDGHLETSLALLSNVASTQETKKSLFRAASYAHLSGQVHGRVDLIQGGVT